MKASTAVRIAAVPLVLAGGLFGARYYRSPAGRQLSARAMTLVSQKVKTPFGAHRPPEEDVFVPTTQARSGSFEASLVAVGALKAKESRLVIVDAFGTIVWTCEDGIRVKKGDPIVELQNDTLVRDLRDKDTALANAKQKLEDTKRDLTLAWENGNTNYQKAQQELEILKAQDKSAIEQAEADLSFKNTDLALARVQYSKDERLAEEKLVPQTQADADAAAVKAKEFTYQKSQGDLDLKKGQLASGELTKQQEVGRLKFAADTAKGRIDSEVKNAQVNVETTLKQRDDLGDQIKKSVVTAPADGIVVLASRWDGAGSQRPIRPGDQVGRNQKVCELPDVARMQVTLEVEQKDIGPIRVGLPVRIRLDPFPDRVYHGQVTEVAAVAKASSVEGSWMDADKNTFTTVIDIKESDPERLRPGMNATLEIYSSHLEHVTYIPLEAMFRKNDQSIVYLQQGTRFRAVPLVLGPRNKDKIVVQSGVSPGQQIALIPPPSAMILNGEPPSPKHPLPAVTASPRVAALPRR